MFLLAFVGLSVSRDKIDLLDGANFSGRFGRRKRLEIFGVAPNEGTESWNFVIWILLSLNNFNYFAITPQPEGKTYDHSETVTC